MRLLLWVSALLVGAVMSSELCAAAVQVKEGETKNAWALLGSVAVPPSLRPAPYIHVGGCLRLESGWWAYELCPGKWVRQYHVEQGAVASEYFLGLGSAALDADAIGAQPIKYQDRTSTILNQIEKDAGVSQEVQHMDTIARCRKNAQGLTLEHQVVVEYPLGSMCEASGSRRRTSVIYVCDKTANSWNLTESSSCVYTVFVTGEVACRMMNVVTPTQRSTNKPASQSTPPLTESTPKTSRRKLLDVAGDIGSTDDVRPIVNTQLLDESGEPWNFDEGLVFATV